MGVKPASHRARAEHEPTSDMVPPEPTDHLPAVTVAIPFRDARSTLPDAIRSVFAQTFGEWELLLVDDGSKDGSREFAASIRDPRVRLVADGENRGLPSRLNQIAQLARGEILARMDADDLMHPERLRIQVELLRSNPAVQLTCSAAVSIDPAGELLGVRGEGPLATTPSAVLRAGIFLIHPSVTGRRSWFRANPYTTSFDRAQDHELWIRSDATSVTHLHGEPLLFYREGQSGPRAFFAGRRAVRRIMRAHGPRHLGRGETACRLARSHVAVGMYRLGLLLGRDPASLSRPAHRPFRDGEAAGYQEILAAIRSTPLPLG